MLAAPGDGEGGKEVIIYLARYNFLNFGMLGGKLRAIECSLINIKYLIWTHIVRANTKRPRSLYRKRRPYIGIMYGLLPLPFHSLYPLPSPNPLLTLPPNWRSHRTGKASHFSCWRDHRVNAWSKSNSWKKKHNQDNGPWFLFYNWQLSFPYCFLISQTPWQSTRWCWRHN